MVHQEDEQETVEVEPIEKVSDDENDSGVESCDCVLRCISLY